MSDLMTLVPPGSLSSFGAKAINDGQQIVGGGTIGYGQLHGILLTPSAVMVDTHSLPDGSVGDGYSAKLAASYGSTPYAWSLAPNSAPLPPGLSLSSEGLITGSPSQAGTYSIVVQVTDGVGAIAQRGLSLRVFPFTLSAYGSAAIDGVLDPNEWAHAS